MTSARRGMAVAAVLGLLAAACGGAPRAPARTSIESISPIGSMAPSATAVPSPTRPATGVPSPTRAAPAGVAEKDGLRLSLFVPPAVGVGELLPVTLEVSNVGSQRIAFDGDCNPRLTVEIQLPVSPAGKTWSGRMARAKEFILGAPGRDTNAYPLYYKSPYEIRFDWAACTYPPYIFDYENRKFVPYDADKVGARSWAVPFVLAPGESFTVSTTRVVRLLSRVLALAGPASVVAETNYVPQIPTGGDDGHGGRDLSLYAVPTLSVRAPIEFTGTGPRLLSAGEAVDAALRDARFAAWVKAHAPEKWSPSNLLLDPVFETWDVELVVNQDVSVAAFVDPVSGTIKRFCQNSHCTKWRGG